MVDGDNDDTNKIHMWRQYSLYTKQPLHKINNNSDSESSIYIHVG